MQRVGLDPLAAVKQPPQRAQLALHADAAGRLERVDRAHLVGDRADAADARGDVRHLAEVPPAQERLEEARGLVDAELDVAHLAAAQLDGEAALALHAGQRLDDDRLRPGGRWRYVRLVLIGVARGSEGRGPGVVAAEGAHQVGARRAQLLLPPAAERGGVGRFRGPEAAEAAALVGGAERPAAGLRDGPEAGRRVRGHHAHGAAPLALEAHRVGGDVGPAAEQERPQHLDELALADRAAAQLEVHPHVLRDRRRGSERADVLRRRVDGARELAHVLEVAQRLDAAGGGAGPDRDQEAATACAPPGCARRRARW